MKIRHKILVSLISMLALLILVITATYRASLSVDYFRKKSVLLEEQLVALTNLRAQVRNQLLETYEVGFVEGPKGHEDDLANEKKQVQSRFHSLEKLFQNGDKRAAILDLKSEYELFDKDLDKVIELSTRRNLQAAKAALLSVRENRFNLGFVKKITEFIESQKVITAEGSKNLDLSIAELRSLLLLFIVLAILLTGILTVYISKSISARLARLVSATQKISGGDFSMHLVEDGMDEVSILSKAFNRMTSSLLEAKTSLLQQQEIITYSSKMSALGEMAGGIAHEINTPLAVILMRTAQLLDYADKKADQNDLDKETLFSALQAIDKTARRIGKIIGGLKSFARDGMNDPLFRTSFAKIVDDTLALCSERFVNNSIEIEIDIPPNIEIMCRPTAIEQVLLNLLNNAFDAIQNLSEKWIKIELTQSSNLAILSVSDSGNGIPVEVQSKIMQPFFTTKEIGKGTGLGLSISKGIIESHGGEIKIDSTKKNTTFLIQIPVCENAA